MKFDSSSQFFVETNRMPPSSFLLNSIAKIHQKCCTVSILTFLLFIIGAIIVIITNDLCLNEIYPGGYYVRVSEIEYKYNPMAEESVEQNFLRLAKWDFPKTVWTFNQLNVGNRQEQLFRKLNFMNTKSILSKQNYTINRLDLSNYTQYLSFQAQQNISHAKEQLQSQFQIFLNSSNQSRNLENQQKQFQEKLSTINKRLIIYHLLLENGGVYVDNQVTLVQNFSTWLEDVMNLPFVNVGDKINSQIQPQFFGFFNSQFSSKLAPANVKRSYEFEKKLVTFPVVEDYFLACNQKSLFLAELIETYLGILLKGSSSEQLKKINPNTYLIGKLQKDRIYEHGHFLSQHIVLQRRQSLLNQNQTGKHKRMAIDEFGLITMNQNIGPFKLSRMFESQNHKKISFLQKLTIQELEIQTGKFRYITIIDNYNQWLFGQFLVNGATDNNFILENSFFHRYFLSHIETFGKEELRNNFLLQKVPSIEPTYYNSEDNLNNSQWNRLNKNIWVVWIAGSRLKSNTIIQLCIQNLRQSAKNSGFEFNEVNEKNVHDFLDQQILDRISNAITNAADPGQISQKISDLWRLALVYKYGGVYLDASTFQIDENFDWLLNVTRISSGLFWNRYGQQPDVVMAWNGYYGAPTDWTIDRKHRTKSQKLLSLQNNFIAAVKESKLIKQWLDCFIEWIPLAYNQIESKLIDVGIHGHKWISEKSMYLLAMQSLKYVIAKKQQYIDQHQSQYRNAHNYYKIWSFLGQMIGQQKLRGDNNILMQDYRSTYTEQFVLNLFRHKYSIGVSEQLLGPIRFQTKFFGLESRSANILIEEIYKKSESNFTLGMFKEGIHPESFFAKKLLLKYPQKTLQSLKFYVSFQKHHVVKCLGL